MNQSEVAFALKPLAVSEDEAMPPKGDMNLEVETLSDDQLLCVGGGDCVVCW